MATPDRARKSGSSGFTLVEPILVVVVVVLFLELRSAVHEARVAAERTRCMPSYSFQVMQTVYLDSRQERVTIEQIETEPGLDRGPDWLAFKQQIQTGDELWTFRNPAGYPRMHGVMIVRNGKLAGSIDQWDPLE